MGLKPFPHKELTSVRASVELRLLNCMDYWLTSNPWNYMKLLLDIAAYFSGHTLDTLWHTQDVLKEYIKNW